MGVFVVDKEELEACGGLVRELSGVLLKLGGPFFTDRGVETVVHAACGDLTIVAMASRR